MSGQGGVGVSVMRGTINDSPWGGNNNNSMEINDSSGVQSSLLSDSRRTAAKNNNRSNAYIVRAPDHHDFLVVEQQEEMNDDEYDEVDECCLGCCSRRGWRMRFLQLGSLVDFFLSMLLLTYGGILAHHHHHSLQQHFTTTTTSSLSIIKTEQVLCIGLLWTGILFLLRAVNMTIAVSCQQLSRRAGGIDAHDVGCCQACSLMSVVYILTPLVVLTFGISSATSAVFHKPLLECLSKLLQEIIQQDEQQQDQQQQQEALAFTTRYFIVPILELSVQHSHWTWLIFLLLALIEFFVRRKLYVWHYHDVYQQEEASMVPSWQRRSQRRQRAAREGQDEDSGGSGVRRQVSSDGRPWWWDRSRSFIRRHRHQSPVVGNENLTEALLQDDFTNTIDRQHQTRPQQRRRRAWWRLFSRNSDDDHDNIRDGGSVDFASVQEEWEIRSQGNPTWWADDDNDHDTGGGMLGRDVSTDLSWAEHQQRHR